MERLLSSETKGDNKSKYCCLKKVSLIKEHSCCQREVKSSFDVGVIVTFSNPQLSSGEPTLVHIALHVEVPAIQNFRLDSGEIT